MPKQRYPKPKFSDEAKDILNHYYAKIRLRYGSPRIRETIYKIARNIARLKLKDIIDEKDVKETITFYNVILQQIDMVVATPSSPKDTAYQECLKVLMDSRFPILFEEVIKTVCESQIPQVHAYIGKSFSLGNNKKLREVLGMLRNHSRIKETQNKPLVLQYIPPDPDLYDQYDQYDHTSTTPPNNIDEKNMSENEELPGNQCRKKYLKHLMGWQRRGHIGHIGHIAPMPT